MKRVKKATFLDEVLIRILGLTQSFQISRRRIGYLHRSDHTDVLHRLIVLCSVQYFKT